MVTVGIKGSISLAHVNSIFTALGRWMERRINETRHLKRRVCDRSITADLCSILASTDTEADSHLIIIRLTSKHNEKQHTSTVLHGQRWPRKLWPPNPTWGSLTSPFQTYEWTVEWMRCNTLYSLLATDSSGEWVNRFLTAHQHN